MRASIDEIRRMSDQTSFRPEFLEKTCALLELLDAAMRHPFLAGKLALKGGTALNLFYHQLPRLSVDIDFNYIASSDREAMLADKEGIETAIDAICQRLGMAVRRQPTEHAGGKWTIKFQSVLARGGNLEIDLNYLYRVPLWPTVEMASVPLADHRPQIARLLDLHELAAGKLCALFARSAARDVFDSVLLLNDSRIDPERLRLGFVIYGAMSRRDWREVDMSDLDLDARQFAREVSVLVRNSEMFDPLQLMEECRELVGQLLLPLRTNEVKFLKRMNEHGVLEPSLITADPEMQARLLSHPALQWKAQCVRQHRGLSES